MKQFIVAAEKVQQVIPVLLSLHNRYPKSRCAVVGAKDSPGLRWSSLCTRHVNIDLAQEGDDVFVDAVAGLTQHMPGAMMLPVDCRAARICNRVRDRLSLEVMAIPDLPMLDLFEDKWRFYEFCTRQGLPVPPTIFIGSKHELDFDIVASELGLPFVLKPINHTNSRGVCNVSSKTYFNEAVLRNDAYQYLPLIAQKFIDGVDTDVSFLSFDGRMAAYAIQQYGAHQIDFVPNAELERIAGELCIATRYNGINHIDARIESGTGRVFLIESNPRLWSSVTASVWCGLNFVGECVEGLSQPEAIRRLTVGSAFPHPLSRLIDPTLWMPFLFDGDERGRMLRAMVFDAYFAGLFLGRLRKHTNRRLKSWRSAHPLTGLGRDWLQSVTGRR